MARQRSSETGARRRLSVSFEDCISCVLFGDQHSHFSTPTSWKSKEACSLVLSLQVQTDSHVCRPCRDNLGRILIDPVHVPRWRRETKRECCIDNCRDISFASSHIVNSKYEEALPIANLKCSIL